jgi:hypothetical protein
VNLSGYYYSAYSFWAAFLTPKRRVTIKLMATDRALAKEFSEMARGLFDGVPEFDEKTSSFSCHTVYALNGEDVRLKIENMGYVLNWFKAIEIRE